MFTSLHIRIGSSEATIFDFVLPGALGSFIGSSIGLAFITIGGRGFF
jgi:hypothetical protein